MPVGKHIRQTADDAPLVIATLRTTSNRAEHKIRCWKTVNETFRPANAIEFAFLARPRRALGSRRETEGGGK